jgi:hypothetical protein
MSRSLPYDSISACVRRPWEPEEPFGSPPLFPAHTGRCEGNGPNGSFAFYGNPRGVKAGTAGPEGGRFFSLSSLFFFPSYSVNTFLPLFLFGQSQDTPRKR